MAMNPFRGGDTHRVTETVVLTVVLALAGAFFYALSDVLEQHEAMREAPEHSLHVSLLVRLVRRPLWLLGFASDAAGYMTVAAALAVGALAFVQPILATGLLMSLWLGSRLNHRHFRHADWFGAALLCAGLALFLGEVAPGSGSPTASATRWLQWGPLIVAAFLACVVSGRHAGPRARAALLGMGAAIAFATSTLLTKGFVSYFDDGIFGWVDHWEPYAMAAVVLTGFVVAQSSFQAGHLAASVAALDATEPIVAVLLGVGMLHESVSVDTLTEALAVALGAVVMLAGVMLLSGVAGEVMEANPGVAPHHEP